MARRVAIGWVLRLLTLGATLCAQAPARAGDAPAAPPPASPPASRIDAERARNQKAYDLAIAGLRSAHDGEWVAIAEGKVGAVAKEVEGVLAASPAAPHRFVFRVGDDADVRHDVTEWYGPRFAGPGLSVAMGFDFAVGPGWRKPDGTPMSRPAARDWFPRTPLEVGAPGAAPETLDVFVGTVGPPLVLTPDDFDRLGLARFEVPGRFTVNIAVGDFDVPCRRATVVARRPGTEDRATLVAAVPLLPRAQLVNLGRGRDLFFVQGTGIWAEDARALSGKWVLFGVDHVLGTGATPAEALAAGEDRAPEAYHRFLVRLPVRWGDASEAVVFDASRFVEETKATLGGTEVTVRRDPRSAGPPVFLADAAVASRLRLELAEDARCVFVETPQGRRDARAGATWWTAAPSPERRLAWVVYALPEGETVWYCRPTPPPGVPK